MLLHDPGEPTSLADVEDAQRAKEELNNTEIKGKKIKVDFAEARQREGEEKRPRAGDRAKAEREQQILAAAEEVFAERGFQNTSMDEVSLRVGVSKPMLYEYFSSKEGLLLACVARIRADLHSATLDAVSAAEPHGPRAVLEAGLEAYFDFADRHGRDWAVPFCFRVRRIPLSQ